MNYSAIAISTRPELLESLGREIDALPWAEVYHTDEQGRMIVVIEGNTTGLEVERLKELKAMEGVGFAKMVVHYFGEEKIPEVGMAPDEIPEYLNDDEAATRANHYQRLKAMSNY